MRLGCGAEWGRSNASMAEQRLKGETGPGREAGGDLRHKKGGVFCVYSACLGPGCVGTEENLKLGGDGRGEGDEEAEEEVHAAQGADRARGLLQVGRRGSIREGRVERRRRQAWDDQGCKWGARGKGVTSPRRPRRPRRGSACRRPRCSEQSPWRPSS